MEGDVGIKGDCWDESAGCMWNYVRTGVNSMRMVCPYGKWWGLGLQGMRETKKTADEFYFYLLSFSEFGYTVYNYFVGFRSEDISSLP